MDQYNEDILQTHQCEFIAPKVQQIEELKHAVFGCEVEKDGKETIRALNYNDVFTYSVKVLQELSDIV